jgi:hypothetical protein
VIQKERFSSDRNRNGKVVIRGLCRCRCISLFKRNSSACGHGTDEWMIILWKDMGSDQSIKRIMESIKVCEFKPCLIDMD